MTHVWILCYLLTNCIQAKLQESNIMDMSGRFQLDVDINTVIFRHHHMFSKEHVLAAQLSQQFEEYVSRTKRQVTEYLTGKVELFPNKSFLYFNYRYQHLKWWRHRTCLQKNLVSFVSPARPIFSSGLYVNKH